MALVGTIIESLESIKKCGPWFPLRIVLSAALAALMLTVLACGSKPPAKPNILLIVLDAARADAFSCYGYQRHTTPHMDTLAANGLRFTNAVSSTSWTFPSHASMFTGLSPYEHGAYHQHGYLLDRYETLAEVLKADGYRTGGFSNNPVVARANNLAQGFDRYDEIWTYKNPARREGYRNSQYTNRQVVQFLEESPEDEPFFVFINYMDTHNPYYSPEPYHSMFLDDADEVSRNVVLANYNNIQVNNGDLKVSPQEFDILRKYYDGSLRFVDQIVKDLLTDLDEMDLLESTMVVITSDHGEIFGRWGHYTHNALLYRPLIHVPLIIHYPPLIDEPRVIDQPVGLEDIFRSLTGLLGISTSNKTGLPNRYLFADSIGEAPAFSMLKVGKSKKNKNVVRYSNDGFSLWTPSGGHYIYFEGLKWDCYDLASDFEENNNLFPRQVSRDSIESVIQQYRSSLIEFSETEEDLVLAEDDNTGEANRLEALKSLGYLGDEEEDNDPASAEMHPHLKQHYERARFYASRDSAQAAVREFQVAISMSPQTEVIREDLAIFLLLKKRFGLARQAIEPIYGSIDVGTSQLLIMSRIALKNERADKAVTLLQKAVSRSTGNTVIKYELIEAALLNDMLPYSVEQAAELIGRLGNEPDEYIRLANMFLASDCGEDIAELFVDTIDEDTDPYQIAVGYSLCKIEDMDQELEKLLPLIEQSELSLEDIEKIDRQLRPADSSEM